MGNVARGKWGRSPMSPFFRVRMIDEKWGQRGTSPFSPLGFIMSRDLGAVWLSENRYRFRVWAPFSNEVHLHTVAPDERVIRKQGSRSGYHQITVDHVAPGTRYLYRLDDGTELPDPVSRYQPEGVYGPSQVLDSRFRWGDQYWFGLPIENYIIYELHV